MKKTLLFSSALRLSVAGLVVFGACASPAALTPEQINKARQHRLAK